MRQQTQTPVRPTALALPVRLARTRQTPVLRLVAVRRHARPLAAQTTTFRGHAPHLKIANAPVVAPARRELTKQAVV